MSFLDGDKMKKRAAKMALDMIGLDTIEEAITGMLTNAIDFKKGFQLLPGEHDVCAIQYEANNEVYFAIAVINADDQITRYENVRKIKEVVREMITNFTKS